MKNKFRVIKDGLRFPDVAKCAKVVQICFALWNFILEKENDPIDTSDIDGPTENDVLVEGRIATNKKLCDKFF